MVQKHMNAGSYLMYSVLIFAPLIGAATSTIIGRARMLFLCPLWLATLAAGMLGYALLYADLKNDQEIEVVVIMMVCGATAWAFLLLTLAYRVPLEQDPGTDDEAGDEDDEQEAV